MKKRRPRGASLNERAHLQQSVREVMARATYTIEHSSDPKVLAAARVLHKLGESLQVERPLSELERLELVASCWSELETGGFARDEARQLLQLFGVDKAPS